MTLRSDRHLATLCSTTVLLLRGRLVDKAPGARLLIKARALHSDAHRRSRIYGRNRIAHSNLRQVLAPRLGPYMVERKGFELPVRFGPSDARERSVSRQIRLAILQGFTRVEASHLRFAVAICLFQSDNKLDF